MATAVDPMVPTPYRVRGRTTETHDSVTLSLLPVDVALPGFVPGQFMMVAASGVGEVALSISGDPVGHHLQHTVRAVGAVSRAICNAPTGSVLGVRGPFGTGWDLRTCIGRDVVIVAGGAGLAAVRSAVLTIRAARTDYRRVVLVVGARGPTEILFRDDLTAWSVDGSIEVEVTVDQPSGDWDGPVGFVTDPLGRLDLDPGRTTVLMCGPEPMMRFAARVLIGKGIAASDIRVSLERNMQCGTALCGHCQLGELLLCRDGPVVDFAVAGPLLHVREL